MTFKITVLTSNNCESCEYVKRAIKELKSNGIDIEDDIIEYGSPNSKERCIKEFGKEPMGVPFIKIESECKCIKELGFTSKEHLVKLLNEVSCSNDVIKSIMED